eukprot:PhM_4_TR4835/c0_g1_i1/m.71676/K15920/XYL4; beta-D-xylosidase 4
MMTSIPTLVCVLVVVVFGSVAAQTMPPVPTSPGCTTLPCSHACNPPHDKYDFCDTTKSFAERAKAFVAQLTQKEKIGLIGADGSFNSCNLRDFGVERLGVGPFMWLDETNTGVAAACMAAGHCSTTFTSPAALAATFNRTVFRQKGEVLSTESRAYNNVGWYRAPNYMIEPVGYGPNLNMVRDPRWGRNCEVPSEDPYLSGTYGQYFMEGTRGDDPRYVKMHAFLKHYTAYSVENNRAAFNGVISQYDLFDTYLAQFKIAFINGSAPGAMCAYDSINGVPSCANSFILRDVVRQQWARPDVLFTSDCGAVSQMATANHYAANLTDAAAKALNAGMDLNTETTYTDNLATAIAQGMTTDAILTETVERVMTMRMQLGQFDPLGDQKYAKIPADAVNSQRHRDINYEATLQSLVLLKNDGVLPLKKGRKIAVVGPHAITQKGLLEDYAGDAVCSQGDDCIQTLGQGVINANGAANTVVHAGVTVAGNDTSGIPDAVNAAKDADVVILMVGIDTLTVEKETVDRQDLTLPGQQVPFVQEILALKKPTVMVVVNGGAVALDGLIDPTNAIIEAFYPSVQGSAALSTALFGDANRFGKLPYSIYAANYINEVDMNDMSMTNKAGRTYRYYQNTPQFPFGHGLSYGKFNNTCKSPDAWTIQCVVCHTEGMPGDEILMVYHRVGADTAHGAASHHPVPKSDLVDFARVSLGQHECSDVTFNLTTTKFELTNEKGARVVYPGTHYMDVSNGVYLNTTLSFNL